MEHPQNKINSFTQLHSWKEGHVFVLAVYKISKVFPKEERLGLTSQLLRAVVSITSNLAEGFSRKSQKEKVQFYFIALGSLTEVQNHLLIAKDLRYITKEDFMSLAERSVIVAKLINGLVPSIRKENE